MNDKSPWLGFDTPEAAFHHLMDDHYDGEGRNPWVVVKLDTGGWGAMTDSEAEQCENVVEWYILQFNPDYSTTLVAWSTSEDLITIQEGN